MNYEAILKEAQEKGQIAMDLCQPEQFVWGQAADIFSNKIAGDTFTETHGDLGGAYIYGLGGKDPFVTWAKKNIPNIVQKDVYKGYTLYTSSYRKKDTQEMEKNAAFARAFADVLKANGIKCAVKTYLS